MADLTIEAAKGHLSEAVDRPRTFFNYTATTDAVRALLADHAALAADIVGVRLELEAALDLAKGYHEERDALAARVGELEGALKDARGWIALDALDAERRGADTTKDAADLMLKGIDGVLAAQPPRGDQVSPPEGWQPIASAPKDGTKFTSQDRVNYGDREFEGTHWYVHQSVSGWNTDDLDCGDYEWEPTHWKPSASPSAPVSYSVADVERLVKALEPFAKAAKLLDGPYGPRQTKPDDRPFSGGGAWREADGSTGYVSLGHLREARAALAPFADPVGGEVEPSAWPWIEWPGGPMPVSRRTLVMIRDRNGNVLGPWTADNWDWGHAGNGKDIVAYGVHPAPSSSAEGE